MWLIRCPTALGRYTLDEGLLWTRAVGRGLGRAPRGLAVHPDDPRIVAAGTADGLNLSRDAAGQFDRLVGGRRVLAQAIDLDGRYLWFSAHLLAATLTCHWLEYVDWADVLLQQPLRIENGCTVVPDRPGAAMVWDEQAVAHPRLA